MPRFQYFYKVYDLILKSQLQLFDLEEVGPLPESLGDISTVSVEIGHVPSSLRNGLKTASWIEANSDECIYHVPGGTRFIVRYGRSIVVNTDDAQTSLRARDYISGLGLPTLAHQRSIIPMHVSMVDTPYGIWAFTGASGAGKSTTAVTLAKRMGWRLLCDDLAVFDPATSGGRFHFGLTKIKLWADAAKNLKFDTELLKEDPVRSNKYHIPVDPVEQQLASKFVAIVNLGWGLTDQPIVKLSQAGTFKTLMNCIHLPELVSIHGNLDFVQSAIIEISARVNSYDYFRAKDNGTLDKKLDAILALILKN